MAETGIGMTLVKASGELPRWLVRTLPVGGSLVDLVLLPSEVV